MAPFWDAGRAEELTADENVKKNAEFSNHRAVGKMAVWSTRALYLRSWKKLRSLPSPAESLSKEYTERTFSIKARGREALVTALAGPPAQNVGVSVQASTDAPGDAKAPPERKGLV